MKKILLAIVLLMAISIPIFACDMMAMIAKNGNTISNLQSITGDYNDPYDFFQFLKDRSNNDYGGDPKPNPDGYGVLYYKDNGYFYLDPSNLGHSVGNPGDPNNQAWYLTGHHWYTNSSYTNKWALDTAQEKIMTPGADAKIVMGHARYGTGGFGNHPFRCEYNGKTFTFMHNGGLGNANGHNLKEVLLTELINSNWFADSQHPSNWGAYSGNITTWIDSEILFNWIIKNIEDNSGNIVEGIHQALTATLSYDGDMISLESAFSYPYKSKSEWHNCVNFILSDGENLYVFNNGQDDSHQLFLQTDLNGFYSVNTYLRPQNNITPINQFDFVTISGDEEPVFYHNFLHKDIKTFKSGWNWVSFPRLTNQGYENDYLYMQAYYEDELPGLFQLTPNGASTITGLETIEGNGKNIIYHSNDYNFTDTNFGNKLFRYEGYKIEVSPGVDPTILEIDGDRLTSYTLNMSANETYWLGYYLPYSQNIQDAFGDKWQYVNRVWAQDWYYDRLNQERGIGSSAVPANSTVGKTMEYGKMYIVQMHENVDNFSWNNSNNREDPIKKETPTSFSYTEKADYEAIDIMNIPADVTEIGVFENNKCVGAVCVNDTCAQILVYSDNANRESLPFSFEYVSGRSNPKSTENYLVLNKYTGKFESSVIFSGKQKYSVVKFDTKTYHQNAIELPKLYKNYPNPFSLTNSERGFGTTISFSLPKKENVYLTIYNIKGQKVVSLYSGIAKKGKHNIIWKGNNSNHRLVSSGIYFYKLKTDTNEITRKMLILK